ncbi:MAG: LEPR-XLL domain-containing protein, partial [Desulfoplanes sp.]|nr:LEPR-XLL domain-containing protein [Desulfoplanes sp.]
MASLNKKASVKVWHKGLIAQLEPRLMYDGAAGVVAVEVMDNAHDSDTADTSHDVTDSHVPVATEQGTAETSDAGPEIAAVLDALESSSEIRCEIAFVDASVQDADTLIAGLDPSMEVY